MAKDVVTWVALLGLLFAAGTACRRGENGKEDGRPEEAVSASGVVLSDAAAKTAAVKVEAAAVREFRPVVEASGTVAFDERRFVRVGPRVAGRVEQSFVFEGDRVRAGQALATLFSPDYLAARAEFLQLREAAARAAAHKAAAEAGLARDMLQAAESKLRLLGLAELELEALRRDPEAAPFIVLHAPFAGRVVASSAVAGGQAETGASLFTIADPGRLWVWAHVFEKDLSAVQAGCRAEVRTDALPAVAFAGRLTLVGATVDETTRTVRSRVEVVDDSARLKPGMFATVRLIAAEPVRFLAVPDEAVRRLTGRTVVFVPGENGAYAARDVTVGRTLEGFTEILSGLGEGDKVVTNGSFSLKAEALKATLEEEP
ncbi:MAG: efflux RND transporter periplasmic adaptor subunit [Candidatus Aminicenantes bacterium]|nr:efflux RND transporter periplasmic adaptor subunit [Candidatus Aminicenantes bacterium]